MAKDNLAIYISLVHKTDSGGMAIPPAHILNKIIPVLEDETNGHTLIIAPPGSAKTNTMIAYCCWLLGKNPNLHIGYLSSTSTQATQRSVAIRDIIDLSKEYRDIFPLTLPDKSRGWAEAEWFVKRADVGDKNASMIISGTPGNILGSRLDLIVLDDIADEENMATALQRAKVINFLQKTVDTRLTPLGRIVLICVTGDSKVSTNKGPIEIKDIKIGDLVWSLNENKQFELQKVTDQFSTGINKVFKVSTRLKEVKATAYHPFLCIEDDGSLVYKKVEDLKKRDKLVVEHELPEYGTPYELSDGTFTDSDFMWLFGFLTGDGWVTARNRAAKWLVCMAKGVHKEVNDKAFSLFTKFGKKEPSYTRFGYWRLDDAPTGRYGFKRNLGQILIDAEFQQGACNKSVPDWIYTLPNDQRKAFILGLLAADGHKGTYSNNSYILSSVSKCLVEKTRLLAMTCGITPAKLRESTRIIQAPHSKAPSLHTEFSCSFNFDYNVKKNHIIHNNGLHYEFVKEIEYSGEEETFDITVENTHNFVVDGMTTANCTRWSESDPADWAMKQGWKKVHIKAIDEEGRAYWPDYWPIERLACPDNIHGKILLTDGGNACYMQPLPSGGFRPINCKKRAGSVAFAQQYQGEVFDEESSIIKRSWWKSYEKLPESTIEKPIDLIGGIFIDTAHTEKTYSDYSVATVMYTDGNKFYIENLMRKKLEFPRLKDEIKIIKSRYDLPLYIESSVGSLALISELKQDFPDVIAWENKGKSKMTRVQSIIGKIEGNGVYLKQDSPWVEDFISECEAFPHGRHDDQVDALSMGLMILGPSKIVWTTI